MTGPDGLLGALFETPDVAELFGDRAVLQGMFDVEAALARAQAAVGVIPAAAAAPIAAACAADQFDPAAIGRAAALAGNPAIPLVAALRARVAAANPAAAHHVHRGATSQDVIDTGMVLRVRRALRLIDADLGRAEEALAGLARRHAGTVMVARTLLQHALPTTFGLKAAGWLSMVVRVRGRLRAAGAAFAVLQFGGAAGTLAALGDAGMEVAEALARDLGLALPDMPWHAQRDRVADLAAALGLVVGALGKVARDVAYMMATDTGEVSEPAGPGKGGSSAMPHKRNPVDTTVALAAATRAPGLVASLLAGLPQEHERGVGGWHAEWQPLSDLVRLTSGAVSRMAAALEGLEVDPEALRRGLGLTRGLVMAEAAALALAPVLGAEAAQSLVERACREARAAGADLQAVLARDPEVRRCLDPAALARAMDPAAYLGSASTLIARALARRTAPEEA
ncbi:MAG TPA: 3-carboxy-cis,cis-muconate cycloisomerase [Azospirillaceae bacterium]|nr:3-carboxy-cis,cis-muconate cycloisomerase [Azospirillaceae bacterium]